MVQIFTRCTDCSRLIKLIHTGKRIGEDVIDPRYVLNIEVKFCELFEPSRLPSGQVFLVQQDIAMPEHGFDTE